MASITNRKLIKHVHYFLKLSVGSCTGPRWKTSKKSSGGIVPVTSPTFLNKPPLIFQTLAITIKTFQTESLRRLQSQISGNKSPTLFRTEMAKPHQSQQLIKLIPAPVLGSSRLLLAYTADLITPTALRPRD